MHEYSLMERVIESILEQLRQEEISGSVAEVALTVGVLEIHSEEATRLAFEVLAKGTPLENSRLSLTVVPARITCPACGFSQPFITEPREGHESLPAALCPQCGAAAGISGGAGVEAIELVIDD